MRFPTPHSKLVDAQGRPYFLWDVDMTLEAWVERLRSSDPRERTYWLARALRDAKPDDALEYASLDEIASDWTLLAPHLGEKRGFWAWLLEFNGRKIPAD